MVREIFNQPKEILRKLTAEGYQAYIVGGAIRDSMMGRPIGDIDIATSALPNQVMEIFPKTIPVGIEHGTVIVMVGDQSFEVTTFRKDEEYIDHRRPTHVQFIESLTEDLKRRDFTINAMAMNEHDEIFDPFHGQAAIKEKKIQTVGNPNERFQEDALRMLRAIRFHSQLSFDICGNTLRAIENNASTLKHISIERIAMELEKIIAGPASQSAMKLLAKTGLAHEITSLRPYIEQLQKWPSILPTMLKTRTEIWALLCTVLEVTDPEHFLKNWKLPTKVSKEAARIIRALEEIHQDDWTHLLMYKLGKELTLSTERLRLAKRELPIEPDLNQRMKAYENLPIFSKSDLAVNGRELLNMVGQPPGPWVSEMLNKMEEAILIGQLDNTKESIKEWLISCNQL